MRCGRSWQSPTGQVLKGEADRMLVVCAQRIEAFQYCSCFQVLAFKLCGMGCSEVSHAGRFSMGTCFAQVLDNRT